MESCLTDGFMFQGNNGSRAQSYGGGTAGGGGVNGGGGQLKGSGGGPRGAAPAPMATQHQTSTSFRGQWAGQQPNPYTAAAYRYAAPTITHNNGQYPNTAAYTAQPQSVSFWKPSP